MDTRRGGDDQNLAELGLVLAQLRSAVLAADLEGIHACTATLHAIYGKLAPPENFSSGGCKELQTGLARRVHPIAGSSAPQTQVRHEALLCAALLRRKQKTMDLLVRALANASPTYAAPGQAGR